MESDLINRQAAIDAINKALDRETLLNSFVRKIVVDAIKVLPSADVVERKKGKWIEIKRNNINPLTGKFGVYVGCSECGCPIPTDSQLDYIDESDALFCFACGADMREERE